MKIIVTQCRTDSKLDEKSLIDEIGDFLVRALCYAGKSIFDHLIIAAEEGKETERRRMEGAGGGMENPKISAYYQTRLAHFGVVSTEWLAQAESATAPHTTNTHPSPQPQHTEKETNFSVIDEFNKWRNHPDLAEAVAAIRALAAVISSSKASTMMQLEIELKNASDSLKVSTSLSHSLHHCLFLI